MPTTGVPCACHSEQADVACALLSGAAVTRLRGETHSGSAVPTELCQRPPALRGRHVPSAARRPALTSLGDLPPSISLSPRRPPPARPSPPVQLLSRGACPPSGQHQPPAAPLAAGLSSELTSTPPAEALRRRQRMRSHLAPRSPSPPVRTETRLRTTRFAHAQKALRAGRVQGSVLWASQRVMRMLPPSGFAAPAQVVYPQRILTVYMPPPLSPDLPTNSSYKKKKEVQYILK